jgi:acetolactate synthase-1/2/3 large subunit
VKQLVKKIKLSGAEALSKAMRACGVDKFFFVAGGDNLGFLKFHESLEKEGLRTYLCRNEKAATLAAEGYARVSKKPVVCYSQHGAAAALLASMFYEPMFAHSPVVALTGSIPTTQKDQWRFQECNEMPYFEATCKFNVDVTDVSRLAEYMRTSIQIAISSCPGPVHVNMHLDMALGVAEMPEIYGDETFSRVPPFRPRAEPEKVSDAVKMLAEAKNPVMVCGSGVHFSGAYDEVKELAELLTMPVATNPKGKGCFPENHSLSVGVMGTYGSTMANEVVRDADVVFFVGTRADSHMTEELTTPEPGASKIVHLDIDPIAIGRNYKADVALLGDAKLVLQDIISVIKLGTIPQQNRGRLKKIEKKVADYDATVKPYMDSASCPIKPQRIIREIMKVLGPRDIVVSDTGQALCWSARLLKLKGTGITFVPSGGTLGSSLPTAIGVALGAEKDQRVLNFIGDGGIGYNLAELETASRYKDELVPLVVLVNNNSSLSMVRRSMDDWSKKEASWMSCSDLGSVNYAKIAEVFECYGQRITRAEDIAEAIKQAFDSGKPALVDVVSEKREYAPYGNMRRISPTETLTSFGIKQAY